jgi:hypothetical protein
MRNIALSCLLLLSISAFSETIKIGYINTEQVVNNLPQYQQNVDELSKEFEPKKQELLDLFKHIELLRDKISTIKNSENNQIIIGHVFRYKNIKRLNIIYTNFNNSEKNIFETVVKWSIDNQIDFIWHVTTNIKNSNNLFSMFLKKKINFAFNTSSLDLSRSLEGGLTNAQGIDSDIDYILRDR